MLFAFTSCLPGISYIYQGEEIGMTNPNFDSIDQYRDVETINFYNLNKLQKVSEGIKSKSRDNSRTPFQ
jgi:trehalose-6-phosphate hydrolase